MTNRSTPPKQADHTVAIIGGVVALFALMVVLAIALEVDDSDNTMSILTVLGTGMGAVVIGQIVQISKTSQAASVAKQAAATAEDTNSRAHEIQHALNSNFDARIRRILREELDVFDQRRDERVREIVNEMLGREAA